MATRIHITASDQPLATVPRRIEQPNIGVYCNSCKEFISFAIEPPNAEPIEFVADAPLLVKCPFCQNSDHMHVAEIRRMPITEANKKRK
jgi:hypothetical protein